MTDEIDNPGTSDEVHGASVNVLADTPDNTEKDEFEQDNQVRLTVVTSTNPKYLTKQYSMKNGSLIKKEGGKLFEGRAEVHELDGLPGFAKLLTDLKPNQATCYGLPQNAPIKIMTEKIWLDTGKPVDTLPRKAEFFDWPDGTAIMMLDYDPEDGGAVLGRDELVATIRSAVPGLANSVCVWYPSASSFITNRETREQVHGLRGQRIYILVAKGSDIPRSGKAICEYSWAAGLGRFDVSSAGTLLDRPLFDASVWQTNRLDFAAGAMCHEPLHQDRGEPQIIVGDIEVVDTATAIPPPDAEVKKLADQNRRAAKKAKATEAATARGEWVESRITEMVGGEAGADTREFARKTAVRALDRDSLSGNFIIHVIEDGQPVAVTVGEVLDGALRYHGMLTLDPLEPGYRGDKVVGKLFLTGGKPRLHSKAHGERTYRLLRQPSDIQLFKGQTTDGVNATIDILRITPEVFVFGDELVMVDRGRIHPLDDAGLCHLLGGLLQYWRSGKNGDRQDADPPPNLVRQIQSVAGRRDLKSLVSMVTAPTLRPDGTVLSKVGYDENSKLLFECDDKIPEIDEKPDKAAVDAALDQLLYPFQDFPLVGPGDWGVLLAALLTCVARPAMTTAPAFGFDAPSQGSGKTLLAGCIYLLGTGEEPTIWPHTNGKDEETRKRLFTALRNGDRCIIWDNVIGVFNSAAMAGAITSGSFTDRILSKSESVSIPNRAIIILTGNNLILSGDMPRRVLICRIDPKCDAPHARQFDLDPLGYVREHRQEMVTAALTIIRGYLTSGAERAKGRMASFEVWDDYIRQTVAWIGRDVRPREFGDPMDVIAVAQNNDPERETLGEMLRIWYELFGDRLMSSGDVLHYRDPHTSNSLGLRQSFIEINSGFEIKSPKSLGRILSYRNGRIVDRLRLEGVDDKSSGSKMWRVVEVSQ